eukprot:scaffold1184_cov132-Cylindrotheca_fusiformis.AAC.82
MQEKLPPTKLGNVDIPDNGTASTMTVLKTELRREVRDLIYTIRETVRGKKQAGERAEDERPLGSEKTCVLFCRHDCHKTFLLFHSVDPFHSPSNYPACLPRPESAMNVEYHQDRVQPSEFHMVGKLLEPVLKSYGGLASVSQDLLRKSLQPIMNALERLDAELLLDLKPAGPHQGPRVSPSQYCQPIYDQVEPPMTDLTLANPNACVRYVHIAEIPDQYSIGIFVFAPFSRIPLHDHPDMCVLSRVLYGDLERHSLDLAREESAPMSIDGSPLSERRKHWLGNWFGRDAHAQSLPKGTKRAFKNHVDHLEAPNVTMLFPYEGNLHEFIAGPQGAAVLDVLLPPYDNAQNRDCTFYEIHDMASPTTNSSGKEACYVVPTGQPENFHCISGRYGDLGEEEQ